MPRRGDREPQDEGALRIAALDDANERADVANSMRYRNRNSIAKSISAWASYATLS
jgi:hypothetical protein